MSNVVDSHRYLEALPHLSPRRFQREGEDLKKVYFLSKRRGRI